MTTFSLERPDRSAFHALTEKQREVLDLLGENRTTKEIARLLGVSDSAVNQRIEPLRQRLGGVTRAELARRYRAFAADEHDGRPCEVLAGQNFQVASSLERGHSTQRDDRPGHYRFEDSMSFAHEPPWSRRPELRIVPRLLDGKYAGWTRGIVILLLLVLIIASLVLGLTAAQVLTETLGERRPGTETSQ